VNAGFVLRVLGVVCLDVLLTASCGAPLMKLPAGPGVPAPDVLEALTQATMACPGIRTLTAEIAVSGKVDGQRLRVRLSTGVAAPGSARVEAVAPFGPPIFILAADNTDATTLLLPRDERVLRHGRSAEVLDAVAGVPMSASDLRLVLTGCISEIPRPEGIALGADWRRIDQGSGDALYLHRDGGAQPWQVAAVIRPPWRVDYRDSLNGLPRSIHITSVGRDAAAGSFDLTLALSQVETNVPLGAEVFRVDVPRTAQPITLEELKHARPGVRKN
jgi:hypothetical protein